MGMRMRRRVRPAVVIVVLSLVACSSSAVRSTRGGTTAPYDGWKTITDPADIWSMRYPPGWYPRQTYDSSGAGQVSIVTNTDPKTLLKSFNSRGLPAPKLLPASMLYVGITARTGETTKAPSTPLPLSLPAGGQPRHSGVSSSPQFYEAGRIYTLVSWIGTGVSAADLSSARQALGSLTFATASPSSPASTVRAANPYLGVSLKTPPRWKVSWTGLPWVQDSQPLVAVASHRGAALASCPKVAPGQVAVFVREDVPTSRPTFDTSVFGPRPATFSLPAPKPTAIQEGCTEPLASSAYFTDAGRYFYALAVFGEGAYPARAADAEAVLNSLVVSKPTLVARCEPADIRLITDHVELRDIYDETVLYVKDLGPACYFAGTPTLTIRSSDGTAISLPHNGTGPKFNDLVLHGKKRLLGWWYFWGWCGSTAPLTYDVASPWGSTSFISPPLAPCGTMGGTPTQGIFFTKRGGRGGALG